MDENECSRLIIGAAIDVHRELGAGLLESAYEAALCHEFQERALAYERQVLLPVRYKGIELDEANRLDVVVEDRVIVEIKSVENLAPIHAVHYSRISDSRTSASAFFSIFTWRACVTALGASPIVFDPLRPLRLCVKSVSMR